LFKQLVNKARPPLKPAAKARRRQSPKQPITEVEVDAMDRMPARDQRPANTFEEIGLRTLEKQKQARN
jgi:hypothetical protein